MKFHICSYDVFLICLSVKIQLLNMNMEHRTKISDANHCINESVEFKGPVASRVSRTRM